MFYAAIFFTTLVLCFLIFGSKKPKNFPPGPKWYPIVGSALQISGLRKKYGMFSKVVQELSKIYNSNGAIGLKIGKDNLVIAYTTDSIKEMLTNDDFDGRPVGLFYETRTFGSRKGVIFTDGDFWKEQRHFIVRHLKNFGFARSNMATMIQNEAHHLLDDLNNMINEQGGQCGIIPMHNLFHVYVLNGLWTMMSGIRYERGNKEVAELLQMFYLLLKDIDMIGSLFSHFPFLRFIAPDYSGYTYFLEIHKRIYEFLGKEVDKHRNFFNLNGEPRDLIEAYLQVLASADYRESFSEQQLLAVCLDMFLAGSETTNKSLGFAFLHMVRDQEIQKKAQAELDAVVGRDRLPTWDDRVNLPYCDAIVHEGIRFFVGNGFGIPHRALRETRLCGYNIPKDTMVIACYRNVLFHEKVYKNPLNFWPDRFVDDKKINIPENYAPFGIGKHRCMGELLGKQNLFCFITTLLQNFTFVPIEGQPLPTDEPFDGATPSVKPYCAKVVKR